MRSPSRRCWPWLTALTVVLVAVAPGARAEDPPAGQAPPEPASAPAVPDREALRVERDELRRVQDELGERLAEVMRARGKEPGFDPMQTPDGVAFRQVTQRLSEIEAQLAVAPAPEPAVSPPVEGPAAPAPSVRRPQPRPSPVPTRRFVRPWVGIDLNPAWGVGAFAEAFPEVAFGASFEAGVELGSFLGVGVQVAGMGYGSTTLPSPDPFVEVGVDQTLVMGHLLARAHLELGILQPWVEGLVGFKHFATETRFDEIVYPGGSGCAFGPDGSVWCGYDPAVVASGSVTEIADTAFSYGVGVGVDIRISRVPGPLGPIDGRLHLGVRYLPGTKAAFLTPGRLDPGTGATVFELREATTEMLSAHLGVAAVF